MSAQQYCFANLLMMAYTCDWQLVNLCWNHPATFQQLLNSDFGYSSHEYTAPSRSLAPRTQYEVVEVPAGMEYCSSEVVFVVTVWIWAVIGRTLCFQGHDTTAAGASWCIYLLGRHPEIQHRVQEELDEVFGESKHTCAASVPRAFKLNGGQNEKIVILKPSVFFIPATCL